MILGTFSDKIYEKTNIFKDTPKVHQKVTKHAPKSHHKIVRNKPKNITTDTNNVTSFETHDILLDIPEIWRIFSPYMMELHDICTAQWTPVDLITCRFFVHMSGVRK